MIQTNFFYSFFILLYPIFFSKVSVKIQKIGFSSFKKKIFSLFINHFTTFIFFISAIYIFILIKKLIKILFFK